MARLRLFANLREAAGTSDTTVPGATVAEVLANAADRFGSDFARAVPIARVWVNGDYKGIYSHVEPIKKAFLARHFEDTGGNLYEGALSDFRPEWIETFQKKTATTDPLGTDLVALQTALEAPDEDLLAEPSVARSARIRMPWLLASFVGGVLAAGIISTFESALSRVAALAGRAVGRRAEVSSGTVAAWKRTKAQVSGQAAARTAARTAAAQRAAQRGVRFEADETTQQHAIDVGGEIDEAAADRPAPVRRREVEEPRPEEDDGDYTSRLLAAKRRARGGGDQDGADG